MARFSNGKTPLLSALFFLNLIGGFRMQLAHQFYYISRAVVTKESLVKQTVLLVVIQLKSPSLSATKYRSESLVNQSLRPYRQVLVVEVVMSHHVVRTLKQLDVLLQIFQVKLLARLFEQRQLGLHVIQASRFVLQLHKVILRYPHSTVKLLDLALMQVQLELVFVRYVIQLVATHVQILGMVDDDAVELVHLFDEAVTLIAVGLL